jgi:hypothetical protein
MAVLFLLLAIIGALVVGDLVLENTAVGGVTVLNQSITGFSVGLTLAMAAALGFVVGLLAVGSASMRRTRRARRRQLRTAERELSGQVLELERENTRLRGELSRRDLYARRLPDVAAADDPGAPATTVHRVPAPPAGRQGEPVYEEARRVARLRRDSDVSFLSTDDQGRSPNNPR